MTNNIHGIGINTNSFNPYGSQPKGGEAKAEEKEQQSPQAQPQSAQVNPGDVLAYMAQQAVVVNPKVSAQKTYDVSKYVTPEQAQRIAGFVTSFEDQVACLQSTKSSAKIQAFLNRQNMKLQPTW